MHPTLFSDDFSTTPYWLDGMSEPAGLEDAPPRQADIVVIGAGYTGLHAALTLSRAGRRVVVLEAGASTTGCSSRNGGQISDDMKPSLSALSRKLGPERALAVLSEGPKSVAWLDAFIKSEEIDCDYSLCGSFHGAHSASQFELQKRAISQLQTAEGIPGLGLGAKVVEARDVREELGTDTYFGGVVYPKDASLQPAKYQRAMLDKVVESGGSVHTWCAATNLREVGNHIEVATRKGTVQAKDVIVATNGYTGIATPWLRRRVIPIGSYMIATEELPEALMKRLMPRSRIVCDTRKVVYYYRPSPDQKRIIFGGRVAHREENPLVSAPKLHRELCRLFPDLQDYKVSHSWMGFVAFTFDNVPHRGSQLHSKDSSKPGTSGIHYAMGYCGSGIALSSYFGNKLALKLLGQSTSLDEALETDFPTRPLYTGNPWFLGAAVVWYKFADRYYF